MVIPITAELVPHQGSGRLEGGRSQAAGKTHQMQAGEIGGACRGGVPQGHTGGLLTSEPRQRSRGTGLGLKESRRGAGLSSTTPKRSPALS
jgi:hypothetical protein